MTPRGNIDFSCYHCRELVSSMKSILFYCDCFVTVCPGCARQQLAKSRVTPYVNLIPCPCCQMASCNLDPSTTMDRLITATETEEYLLKAAITRSKINTNGLDSLSKCKKLIDYSKSLVNGPLLFDLAIDDRSDDELRTYIVKAELCRRHTLGGYVTYLAIKISNLKRKLCIND